MRTVLIISSFLIFSYVRSQDFSYEKISRDSGFKILDIDINRDEIKDKVAYNIQGNDLCFYILKNDLYINVYHGLNYSMDGLYSIINMKGYNDNNNVLYIKSIFNGAGGQTIEYFISYKNGGWQLSESYTNSSTYRDINICKIDYLGKDQNEECINCKRDKITEDDLINGVINNLKKNENTKIISNEFIFCILNTCPLSVHNVTLYNNLAYQLEKLEKNNESIYLLQKVLQKFPNRTVAYINLGDAYWGLDEKENAKQSYQKYIELMKASGKEGKIPQRVLERVKE